MRREWALRLRAGPLFRPCLRVNRGCDAMLSIRKILLPIVLADASRHIAQQAAWLARRFNAEVILLHVVTPFSYPVGLLESGDEITARDLHSRVVEWAQKNLDQAFGTELDGIAVTRILLRGNPAREIVKTARDRSVDLIMMSTHDYGAFYPRLLGSVTAKVLHETDCPVWTGAHLEEPPAREFWIRHVLCSVNLSPHSNRTVSLAAEMATALGATLTLVHVTASVEVFGPGGFYVDAEWRDKIVGFAAEEIAKLQKEVSTKAEVIIESGNVLESLNRAAERTKADVLVIGHIPGRSHLGDNGNGYGIIRASHIPVVSL